MTVGGRQQRFQRLVSTCATSTSPWQRRISRSAHSGVRGLTVSWRAAAQRQYNALGARQA